MKIDWAQKLSSRKFWAAVTGFVTSLLVAFGVDYLTIEQVVALISAMSVLIAYMFSEGMVDAAREKNGFFIEQLPTVEVEGDDPI